MNSIHLKRHQQRIPVADSRKMAAGIDEFAYLLHGGLTDRAVLRAPTRLTTP
jgi:hypothetical protein